MERVFPSTRFPWKEGSVFEQPPPQLLRQGRRAGCLIGAHGQQRSFDLKDREGIKGL